MGKPIVTTEIGGAENLKDVVQIANTPESFMKEIERAFVDTSPDLIQKRKKVAFENSWHNRIKELETLIRHDLHTEQASSEIRIVSMAK